MLVFCCCWGEGGQHQNSKKPVHALAIFKINRFITANALVDYHLLRQLQRLHSILTE